MSLTIQEMHYDFKMKSDKVDSDSVKNFNEAQIDWILNDAYLIWLETRYGASNRKFTGFEETQKRIDDLAPLVIKHPRQASIAPTSPAPGLYELDLNRLDYPYLHAIRLWAQGTKDDCVAHNLNVSIIQHDDLQNVLGSPFTEPSFRWREVPAAFGRNEDGTFSSIFFYTNEEFTIDEVFIEYLKEPKKLWFGNYDYYDSIFDNTGNLIYQASVDSPVSCELNNKQCREIVDVGVEEVYRYLQNPAFLQLNQSKISE